MTCTLFSVSDADLAAGPATETSLPGYDETSARMSAISAPHAIALGDAWKALPLPFLTTGGAPFAPLEDAANGSAARYFSPRETMALLVAVAKLRDEQEPADVARLAARVRVFLAEAVEAERGVIVHTLS